MTPSRITPLALALLTGCGGGDIEGIWHFYLAYAETPDDQCVTDLLHNFNNVYTPADEPSESDWTEASSEEHSDGEFFGSIQRSGDATILTIGTAVFEGTEVSNNQWSFHATSYSTTGDSLNHASGYVRTTEADEEADFFIEGLFDKGGFVGSSGSETTTINTWTESDAWSIELSAEIGTTGQIPVSSYLLREYEGNIVPIVNSYDRNDCSSDPCTLSLSTECSMSWSMSAHITDLPPDGWDVVDDVNQGQGYQGP